MKETKGLSEEQVKRLYYPANAVDDTNFKPIGRHDDDWKGTIEMQLIYLNKFSYISFDQN